MRHQDLTINHRLESWVYANAAARTGATGFVAGDVGRISYQTDTGQYWRLTATTPTWLAVGPPPNLAYAVVQGGQASPSPTVVTTPGVMMGFASTITPTATGKILVTIAGTLSNDVAGKSSTAQMRYGTGTPPANGASGTTGSVLGGAAVELGNVVNAAAPFSLSGVITGAALGVAVWFDLQVYTNTGGTARITGASVTLTELP